MSPGVSAVPEGDTVFRQAALLHRALAGRVLESAQIRVPAFAAVDLSGASVESALARGKHLLIRTEQMTIHSHLKMDGVWHVYSREGSARPRWRRPGHTARCVLTNSDNQAVGFSLGELHVVSRAEEKALLAHLGPDLLGADWDAEEACRRLAAAPERALGAALLDQRNLAGIGNIFRSEICFLARCRPETPVGQVGDLSAVVELSRRLLEANKNRSRRSTTGSPQASVPHWVYGRAGKLCLRCHGTIVRYEIGEERLRRAGMADRSVYVCPVCQAP